eukprot:COSAG02_NODE_49553_length_326_cov_0.678414_1_plen_25_part_10
MARFRVLMRAALPSLPLNVGTCHDA